MAAEGAGPGASKLQLSRKDIQEFYEIVAETKVPPTNSKYLKLSPSKPDTEFLSLNWLINADSDPEDDRGVCLKFCCQLFKNRKNLKSKSVIAAILAWDTKHCKTFEDLLELMTLVTVRAEESAVALKSIYTKLAFTDDPDPDLRKLSVVGGYLWLTTFTMQYVTFGPGQVPTSVEGMTTFSGDKPSEEIQFHPNPRINTWIMETHDAYEEIGEAVQGWIPISVEFLKIVKELRVDSIELVKELRNRFRIIKNPFKIRPYLKKRTVTFAVDGQQHQQQQGGPSHEFEAGVKVQMERKSTTGIYERGVHDESLKVQWSPTVVLVQATPNGRWEIFSTLALMEKVELIQMFSNECSRLLKSSVNSYKRGITPSNTVEQPGLTRISNISEVACGILHFTSTSKFRKLKPDAAQLAKLEESLEKFWLSVDELYKATLKVSKLISETRDIIRSCYLYSDNFYNWKLKNFEYFTSIQTTPEQDQRMKKFASKIVGKNEVVDVAKFFSIADFSTSHYQFVLQEHPVHSHGVGLKLESWDEYGNEPWGLLENVVDKRKLEKKTPKTPTTPSKKEMKKSFKIAYQRGSDDNA